MTFIMDELDLGLETTSPPLRLQPAAVDKLFEGSESSASTRSIGHSSVDSGSNSHDCLPEDLRLHRTAKRRRDEEGRATGSSSEKRLERWIAHLETHYAEVRSSLESRERSLKAAEQREETYQQTIADLQRRAEEHEQKAASADRALRLQRQEVALLKSELASRPAAGDAAAADLQSQCDELKENLRTVAQLLLSGRQPVDASTTQLLEVLTAPIGGLAAVGSRSGVLGLDRLADKTGKSKSNEGSSSLPSAADQSKAHGNPSITPLSLMGAAVGPMLDAPEPSTRSSAALSSLLPTLPGSSTSSFMSGTGLRLDFGFRVRSSPQSSALCTLFGSALGFGVSFCAFDVLHGPSRSSHAPPATAAGQTGGRRLLQVAEEGDVSPAYLIVRSVVFYGVLTLGIVFLTLLAVKLARRVAGCIASCARESDKPLLPHDNLSK
ncbi:hypothetical protein DIPPA_18602 [Diplonema papillatum]|nr:hypothetical protein DIPPA_18602 [Diplonema papillatum]